MKAKGPRIKRRLLLEYRKEFKVIIFCLMGNGGIPDSGVTRDRRIRAWFGCSLTVIAKMWYMLDNSSNGLPERATQERLLWGLVLMKSHDSEENNASRVSRVDKGTFREWS